MTVDLKPLLEKLPLGWADTIRDRLERKYGTSYIKRVVYGNAWNVEIADEAIKLASEHEKTLAAMKAQVDAISSNTVQA